MTGQPTDSTDDWSNNYFNYFTEIEEHFQRARGTALFLMSPLDWALIENWKNADVPLEAVLLGIDRAFEKWRSQKKHHRMVNSLAYCTQAVLEAAQRTPAKRNASSQTEPPFSTDQLARHLGQASSALRKRPETIFSEIAAVLEDLAEHAEEHLRNLEDLERRLTALEEKLIAALRTTISDDKLYEMRVALDRELKPYRGKMNAEQLSMLERRYLDNALLEASQLPRLSLFYLH